MNCPKKGRIQIEGREEEFSTSFFNKRERSFIGHINIWFCLHKIKDADFWETKWEMEIKGSVIVSRRHVKSQINNEGLLDMKTQGLD
jgi:hypothetical protein